MLLIGAKAAQFWFPDEARPSAVWDLWAARPDFDAWRVRSGAAIVGHLPRASGRDRYELRIGGERIGLTIAPPGASEQAFIAACSTAPVLERGPLAGARVAPPLALALIKRCHLYDPTHWHRHIEDYHFLKARAASLLEPGSALERAYAMRNREWAEAHPGDLGSGSMRVPNEAFFGNSRIALIRAYSHDDLHAATCYGDRPMYQMLKDDPSLAYVSPRRFEALSHVDRIRLVREESYALALERVVVPALELGLPYDAERAFLHGLRRICTNLARGWFRDFAIEHYPEIRRFDTDYVGRFLQALGSGRVRRLEPIAADRPWPQRLDEHLQEVALIDAQAAMA